MLQKPGWDRSLARWSAFWSGEVADRPPVLAHVISTRQLDPGPPPSLDSTLARYDPARNRPILDQAESTLARIAALEDDTPPAIAAGGGVYFTGAAFGAPVVVTADMMTSAPVIDGWDQAADIGYDPDNPWIRRALGLARQLVARSDGRYAVTPGLLEGPSDICASLRSPTRLASDLYEHPHHVQGLAEMGADAWQRYARALHEIIPLYDGGTVTQWSMWVPGRAAALQEDFCTLISPRQYREFFLPLDRQLARSVDTLWMHIHAGAIHLIGEILTVDEVRGIQIVYDGPVSGSIWKAVPVMRRVQERGKCLILRKYPPEDLEAILPHLSARRLALDVYFTSASQARQWLRRVDLWAFGSISAQA